MNRGKVGKEESVDEKSMCLKRLKGGTSSQKHSEISARSTDITRFKSVGVHRTLGASGSVSSKTKSKLRGPTKLKPLAGSFYPRVIPQHSQRSEKRLAQDSQKYKHQMKVQQDSAESLHQSKKREMKSKAKSEEQQQETPAGIPVAPDTNGNEREKEPSNDVELKNGENSKPEEIIISETESANSQVIEIVDISDEAVKLQESPEKLPESPPEEVQQEQQNVMQEEKEPCSSEANPADVLVESTTSECPLPSQTQVSPPLNEGESTKQDEDSSFITYDSSIMLKDVKIKLNDCLRENSKLHDVTDPNASMSEAFKDLSFGRTLRSISGRSSIGRLRHVTVRERQLTPNDSLFVNTSNVSLIQEGPLYQPPGVNLDLSRRNGTPMDRKRKFMSDMNDSAKKVKRDETSILNSSWEYLRSLRRPVQVSTPNPKGYKFDIGEKSEGSEIKAGVDQAVEQKKWCIVM